MSYRTEAPPPRFWGAERKKLINRGPCDHSWASAHTLSNAAESNSKNVLDTMQKMAGNIFKQQLLAQNAYTTVSFSSPSLWGLSGGNVPSGVLLNMEHASVQI